MLSVSSYFTPESGKIIRGQNVKKVDSCFVFPQSPKHLWDMTPQGDSFMFGFQHYPTIDLVCVERCIRLAHKHAIQDVEERGNETFKGFLIGSLEVVEDESGIVVTLDRFDPGIVKDDVIKSPSAIIPNDIIVPVEFTLGKPDDADVVYSCTTGDFQAAIQNLHKNFSSTYLDVSKVFPLRIHCYHTMNNDETIAGLLIRATSVVVSTTVHLTPVTPIPVIPTALAKNLCSSLNVSYVQRIQKSGFMTMDQTRKILLLLDSDPKASRLPTVGVWVSGVMTPYHPYVLMACVRYLHYSGLKERILSEGCYLLALYTVASTKPTFYACKLDQNEKLDFDVLSAQDYIHMYKPNDSSSTFDFKFTLEPPDGSRDRAMFTEALQKSGTFPSPAYQKQSNPLPTISDVTNKPLKQRNHSNKEKTNNDENCPPREFPQITPVEFPSPAPTPTPKYKLDDLEPSILEPSLIYQESFQPPNPHYKTQPQPRNPTILKGNNLNHPHHRSHSHPDPIPTFTHKRTPTPKQTQPPHPYFTPNQPHSRTPTPKTPNHPSKRPHTPNQPHTPSIHPLTKTQTPNPHHLTPQNHLPPNPLHRPPGSLSAPQTPSYLTQGTLQNSITPNSHHPSLRIPTNPHSPHSEPPSTPTYPLQPPNNPPAPQKPTHPPWMQHLPPEAYHLLLQQDTQLKQLQSQVQLLIKSHDNVAKQPHVLHDRTEACTQTEWDFPSTKNTVATNTDILETKDQSEQFNCDETSDQQSNEQVSFNKVNDAEPVEEMNQSQSRNPDEVLNASSEMGGWEEVSLMLGELNNMDDSIASSIKVDIPVLDTSNKQLQQSWCHDSPVLGESASMYQHVRRKSLESKEDDQFFGNLLKQVQTMLKNADIDVGSEASSSCVSGCHGDDHGRHGDDHGRHGDDHGRHGDDHGRHGDDHGRHGDDHGRHGDDHGRHSEKQKKRKSRTRHEKVIAATRKQLRKMGVSLKREDDQTICVVEENTKNHCIAGLPPPLIPHLTYLSILANEGVLRSNEINTITGSRGASEMSIHANAIALKYLSDDQLMKITPTQTPMKVNNEHTMAASMPGMSLISPCNMTMGTRKYMEKYGLIEGGEDESDEPSRGASPELQQSKLPQDVSKENKHHSSVNWSQIQNNLGDTMDMMTPFLQDLGQNEQKPPSSYAHCSGNNRVYDPRGYDSNLSEKGGETLGQIISPRVMEALNHIQQDKVERPQRDKDLKVLSPRLVQALSQRRTLSPSCDQTHQSDDGILMPPPTAYSRQSNRRNTRHNSATVRQGRSGSADHYTEPRMEEQRRMSSSPRLSHPQNRDSPRTPRQGDTPSPRSRTPSNCSDHEDDQMMNEISRDHDFTNVLDMNKIKKLKKLT